MSSPEDVTPDSEQVISPEINSRPPFDAMHIVELEVVGQGEHRRPDPRGLMSITAAADIIQQGVVKNVIISGVHYKDEANNTRISQVYAEELQKRLEAKGISDVNIVAEADTLPRDQIEKGSKDTGGDVTFLLGQAKQNGWQNILLLAYKPHIERVVRLLKARGANITSDPPTDYDSQQITVFPQSSEHVLNAKHPAFSQKFEESPFRKREGTSFEESERKKIQLLAVDPKGYLQSWIAHKMPQWLKEKVQS